MSEQPREMTQEEADEQAMRSMALNLEIQRNDITTAKEYVDDALKTEPRTEID